MTNKKERSETIQQAARRLLEDRKVDVTQIVPYRELAPDLKRLVSCDISTAKRHILKAARLMRGELAPRWGGPREGAGRPAKEE